MEPIKITDKGNTLIIAHRGLSGIEKENTNSAFVAAGNRSYFGIETDLHRTSDGKYVIIHDDNLSRVSNDDISVEKSTYDTLRRVILADNDGVRGRTDLVIPNLDEYIDICKKYNKTSVLELKNHLNKEDVYNVCDIIAGKEYMDKVIFISFDLENLIYLREKYPNQPIQYLVGSYDDGLIDTLVKYKLDLDIFYECLNEERVQLCRQNNIKINCWTVDDIKNAEKLLALGVDYITTDILE